MESTVIQSVAVGFVLGYFTYLMFYRNTTNILKSNKWKFVMVVRSDILKTKNKAAMHCSRVALECYKKAKLKCPDIVYSWETSGQPKVVLKLNKNENEEMMGLRKKAESLGLVSVPLKEECCSSVLPEYTVIGIGPGSEELVNEVTGHLKLL